MTIQDKITTNTKSPASENVKAFLYQLALRRMSEALKQEAYDNNLFNKGK